MRSHGSSDENYLVQRINGDGLPFEVKASQLTSFGSNDPKTKQEIYKRKEFDKVKELLSEKDCVIEEVDEDGNCLFRAVARQIYGDQKKFQQVRGEMVNWNIKHRSYFSEFETNIDERLSKQLMNQSWGGELEIKAMSELYNVGVLVWELSQSGQLVAPHDTTKLAASKGLQSIYLVRHRGVHYNVVKSKNQKLPVIRTEGLPLRNENRDAQAVPSLPPETRDKSNVLT